MLKIFCCSEWPSFCITNGTQNLTWIAISSSSINRLLHSVYFVHISGNYFTFKICCCLVQHTDSNGHGVDCSFQFCIYYSVSGDHRGVIVMSEVHLYTIVTVQCGVPNVVNKNFSLETANIKYNFC